MALTHGLIGVFMPLILVTVMVRFFGENRSWREGLSIAPFALFVGVCFVVPYMLVGVFLGPEFPSLLGGLIGLAIVVPAARKGFLLPKDIWDFPPRSQWPAEWLGTIEIKVEDVAGRAPMSTLRGGCPM